MFHFALLDDPKLSTYNYRKRREFITQAIKLYRKEHPINLTNVTLLLVFVVLAPTLIFYLYIGFNAAVAWGATSTIFLDIKIAAKESPHIKRYLDKVIPNR